MSVNQGENVMKKIISLVVASSYLFTASVCFAYKGECMNEKGKFTKCVVDVSDGVVSVKYKKKKWRHLNREIPGNKITGLSGGEYARRRVAESIGSAVLLGPLFLFVLFSKKKRDNFGIEYIEENGAKDAVLVQVKKKYGFALGQHLETVSGQQIVMKDDSKEKKSEELDNIAEDVDTTLAATSKETESEKVSDATETSEKMN